MSVAETDVVQPPVPDERLDRMLELLQSMDTRLSRLEARLDASEPVGSQVDAGTIDVAPEGRHAQERLSTALAEPQTVASLVRILERLDHIDQSLTAMAQLPDLAAGAVDTVERVVVAAREADLDLNARVQATVALVERFSDPDTVEAVLTLTERLDDLVAVSAAVQPAMRAVAQLPDVASIGVDTIRRVVAQMDEEGLSLEHRLQGVLAVTAAITQPRVLAALERLLEDPALLEGAADLANEASSVVTGALAVPPAPVGPLAAVRALYDPHVQQGLGAVLELARVLGRRLDRG